MARAIDKRIMLDLIIDAKKTDPETGPFSEWLAEYLVDHLPTLTPPPEWVSTKERLPQNGEEAVLCIVSGKPADNITLYNAYELGRYENGGGWIIDMWPEWKGAKVLWWTPLPEPPEDIREEQ